MHIDWWAFLNPLLAVAIPTVAAGLVGLIVQLFRKWGLDISAAKQIAWQEQLADILRSVEEQAAAHPGTLSSSEKLSTAVTRAAALAPTTNRATIVEDIRALLPQLGLGASGAGVPAGTTLIGPALPEALALPTVSPLVPVPGVGFEPPPAGTILQQATALINQATAALDPGKTGALVAVATTRGVNAAVVQKLNDTWSVVGWAGKDWGHPLEAGAAIKASW